MDEQQLINKLNQIRLIQPDVDFECCCSNGVDQKNSMNNGTIDVTFGNDFGKYDASGS